MYSFFGTPGTLFTSFAKFSSFLQIENRLEINSKILETRFYLLRKDTLGPLHSSDRMFSPLPLNFQFIPTPLGIINRVGQNTLSGYPGGCVTQLGGGKTHSLYGLMFLKYFKNVIAYTKLACVAGSDEYTDCRHYSYSVFCPLTNHQCVLM